MEFRQCRLLDSNHSYSKIASLSYSGYPVFVSSLFHTVSQLEVQLRIPYGVRSDMTVFDPSDWRGFKRARMESTRAVQLDRKNHVHTEVCGPRIHVT